MMQHDKPNYSWQRQAIALWKAAGHRGIIEAVTGSGKTHVALGALGDLSAADKLLHTLIVVPTIPLMNQWYDKLIATFPGKKIGRIGGGHLEEFKIPPLAYIATVQSSLRRVKSLFAPCWNPSTRSMYRAFLIGDECHHYQDAEVWRKIVVDHDWTYTLGLSATVDRFSQSGFGRIVTTYRFKDAFRDGLVPPFELINAGLDLEEDERRDYLEYSTKIGKQLRLIRDLHDDALDGVPDEYFFKKLRNIMGKLGDGTAPEIEALFYMLFKRAGIYYMARRKMQLAEQMTRALVENGKKIIVFFERIASANDVEDVIAKRAANALHASLIASTKPIWCRVYHSELTAEKRSETLGAFRKQSAAALIVCRSLDEGLDIPEVDGAILAASTSSMRQRIQRIGRTLRRGDGTKRPVIVTLFARGTGDANITDQDRHEFKGVATIHYCADPITASKTLSDILSEQNAPLPVTDSGSLTWRLIGAGSPEGSTIDGETLVTLADREIEKDQLVRLHFRNGDPLEGPYVSVVSHTITLGARRISTENITHVYVL
jgi:superfamily II DNA or RNA helicase